jgi:hypothetical protein
MQTLCAAAGPAVAIKDSKASPRKAWMWILGRMF